MSRSRVASSLNPVSADSPVHFRSNASRLPDYATARRGPAQRMGSELPATSPSTRWVMLAHAGAARKSPSLRCAAYSNTYLRAVQAVTRCRVSPVPIGLPHVAEDKKLTGRFGTGLALAVGAEVGGAAGDGGRSYGSAASRARHVAFPPHLQKPAHGTAIARQVGHRAAKDAANDPVQPG